MPSDIPQRVPYLQNLAPGSYRWCACGRSRNPPFCDGSHAGSGIEPLAFTVQPRAGTLWLCGCRHTRRPPYCDASHNQLPRP